MKLFLSVKTLGLTGLLGLALVLPLAPAPVRGAELDDNLQNYLQLVRSDFNAAKMEVVNRVMKLSAEDAKKFWPIYREYEHQLGKQAIDRAELIAEYVQAVEGGRSDNAWARSMAKRWFKTQRARLNLLEKYHGKIEAKLSSLQAGQFLQIENQIGLFIDITIASEMPLVGERAR